MRLRFPIVAGRSIGFVTDCSVGLVSRKGSVSVCCLSKSMSGGTSYMRVWCVI